MPDVARIKGEDRHDLVRPCDAGPCGRGGIACGDTDQRGRTGQRREWHGGVRGLFLHPDPSPVGAGHDDAVRRRGAANSPADGDAARPARALDRGEVVEATGKLPRARAPSRVGAVEGPRHRLDVRSARRSGGLVGIADRDAAPTDVRHARQPPGRRPRGAGSGRSRRSTGRRNRALDARGPEQRSGRTGGPPSVSTRSEQTSARTSATDATTFRRRRGGPWPLR